MPNPSIARRQLLQGQGAMGGLDSAQLFGEAEGSQRPGAQGLALDAPPAPGPAALPAAAATRMGGLGQLGGLRPGTLRGSGNLGSGLSGSHASSFLSSASVLGGTAYQVS